MKTIYSFEIRSLILATALAAGVSFVSSASAIEHSYIVDLNSKTVVELRSRGEDTRGVAINDAGQVAGWSRAPGYYQAFVTGPNGVGMTDIGTPGSPAWPTAINNMGQVVGFYEASYGSEQAFITGPNGVGMTDIGTPGGAARATAINNRGQVVGSQGQGPGSEHAFITGPNGVGMTNLGFSDGSSSSAIGINDVGQVVVEGDRGTFITGPNGVGMTYLGNLAVNAINNSGQMVGVQVRGDGVSYHAFITAPNGEGSMTTDLGTLGGHNSFAAGLNDAAQVVGYSEMPDGSRHAFITGPNGVGITDLNSLLGLSNGGVLTYATAINNMGQVVAIGSIPAVPEPASWALTLVGLGLMGFTAMRRRRAGGAEQWLALSDIELAKARAG